jgi:pyruvate-formate lyase-activating enzyme
MLRVDECPLCQNVELASAAGDRLGVETLSAQLGRETRGPRVVAASGGAVVDLDAHARRS